jgi:hypothetical protein
MVSESLGIGRLRGEVNRFGGEEGREVFSEKQGTDGVDGEGVR